jgi:MFS family permease
MRGRVNGLLELAMPLGFLSGMILALALKDIIGWRGVFYVTGVLGIALAALIFLGVREPKRGGSEPEMAGIEQATTYRFNWPAARALFAKRALWPLFLQGFFGVFPWNVITFWFFTYLEKERGYAGTMLFVTMAAAVLVLAAGYPLGGALGDALFKRTPRGRMIVAGAGVLTGAVLLTLTLRVPPADQGLFLLMLALTALFIPFAAPNVIATVYDVTLPEVRSTALAVQYLIESAGAALAPLIAGAIADRTSLQDAILLICVSTWIVCAFFFTFAARAAPRDIAMLRSQMRQRAEREVALRVGAE